MKEYQFETKAVHAGYQPEPSTKANVPPLYMTTAYEFESVAFARDLFALEAPGNIYTRLQNPTTAILEERMSALEGGVAAVATASGHAAITMTMLNLARAGDEIVSSRTIYGGAVNLLSKTFAGMGITVRFADAQDPESFRRLTNEKTRAYFIEMVGNPCADIADIAGISAVARELGVPLVADGTMNTPYLFRPLEWGADIVVHSTTKQLCGSGTAMGGIVVDGGTFAWAGNPRFPGMNEPDESYHGVVYAKAFGQAAFAVKLRAHILRDVGACQSPFNAWVTLLGLETLAVRMDRHIGNARAVAAWLCAHPRIWSVSFPELPESPFYALYQKYFTRGATSTFTFEIEGDRARAGKFCDSLKLLRIVANLGDARSMVSHPATTTHSQLSDEQLAAAGISPTTVRISVGLESAQDILEDLGQALEKAFA